MMKSTLKSIVVFVEGVLLTIFCIGLIYVSALFN